MGRFLSPHVRGSGTLDPRTDTGIFTRRRILRVTKGLVRVQQFAKSPARILRVGTVVEPADPTGEAGLDTAKWLFSTFLLSEIEENNCYCWC